MNFLLKPLDSFDFLMNFCSKSKLIKDSFPLSDFEFCAIN